MVKLKRAVYVCIAVPALLAIAGCASKRVDSKSYKVEGTVISIDKAHQSIMLDAKAIPDYMEAMAMSYDLPDAKSLGSLKPGDRIEATLRVSSERSWLENVRTIAATPNTK